VKIKQKLIALFLFIGLAPTLAVSLVAYVTISDELRTTTTNQLTSIAIKQEQKINSLLQKKQEEVIKLTNNFDFQVALGDYLASHNAADRKTIDTILQTKQTEVSEIQAIYVADTAGTVLASTIDGTEGQKLKSQDYAIPADSDTTITVREDSRDGLNKLYITTQVTVNKKEAAVMNVVFRIDDIVAAVQDYTGLGSTGETIVASKNGNNVVSLFPLRFNTDAALTQNLNSLDLFSGDGNSYRQTTDYRGHAVMVASRSIGFANWVIATKMDRQEALAPIDQLRNGLISIVVLSSIAIILIALYFARFFTNPILKIARTSQQIGHGDFGAHIDLHRNDEIGELGTSINAMGLSLKELVTSIEAQRNRLEVILNSTAESILAIDKSGNIIIANRAASELTSQQITALVGKNITQVFSWKRSSTPVEIDYNITETRLFPDLQYTDMAGNEHYVKVIVAPVAVNDSMEQTSAQTIVTIHDETKSRELEDMKIDFVSMAAHELRTPLAAIRGYLELISYKEKPATSSDVSGYIHQALKSSGELGGLINNLLDVTRIERGTLTLNMEKTDLAADVSQAVKDASFVAKDKNITLHYNGPADSCFVVGDQIALREVINNLLANAVKYTEPNGTVRVDLDLENNRYVVRVADTGIGIPQKALPNLFTKFYRVHGGLDSGSTGTGLGLFISKSIVERHHGSISVESEVGKGSVFRFAIPVLDETHLAAVQSEQQSQQTLTRRHRGWVTKNITR
jgi:PAS domain S-box-containing protein